MSFSDGQLPHGSFEVTMLETGKVFVADNFDIKPNTKKLSRMDAKGRVAAKKVIPQDISGSADFQIEEEDRVVPDSGESFGVDADKDGVAEPYFVDNAGRTFAQDDVFKCKVALEACVNPLIYIPTTTRAPIDRSDVEDVAIASVQLGAFVPRGVVLAATPYTATGLPTGIVCSTAGALSGTPTTPGAYNVTLKVAATLTVDGTAYTRVGIRKFTWTITATP